MLKAGPKFLDSTGPDGGYPIVTTAGASNVTIANLTADQSGDVLNGNAAPNNRLTAYLIDVRNSHNVVVDGVYTRNPFTYSIAVVGSNDFCVVHCNTRVATSGRYNQLDGIHILDSDTGQVIDNYVNQGAGTDGDDGLVAHTIGAPVYDVLYANNTVRGGSQWRRDAARRWQLPHLQRDNSKQRILRFTLRHTYWLLRQWHQWCRA